MGEQSVLLVRKERIAWITLNRPQSLNSMNDALVDELHKALDEAACDNEINVVIVTGNGKAFCAGGDLPYLETLKSVSEKKNFIEKVGLLAKKITIMQKPVIAMVNGVAAGAGVNLMLACDLIYAVDSARFAQSFVRGKHNYKFWGKNRIVNELKFRNISSRIITIALKELPDATYIANFHALAEKNWEQIKERKGPKKNKKFVDFLLRKGYETHLIYDKLRELDK